MKFVIVASAFLAIFCYFSQIGVTSAEPLLGLDNILQVVPNLVEGLPIVSGLVPNLPIVPGVLGGVPIVSGLLPGSTKGGCGKSCCGKSCPSEAGYSSNNAQSNSDSTNIEGDGNTVISLIDLKGNADVA